MGRLKARHLPHRITIHRFAGEGAEGVEFTDVEDVPAYVEQKTRLAVDRRPNSTTAGQEVTSTTTIVCLPDADSAPGSEVTVFPGTPRERRSQIVDSALGEYSARTPNHVEFRVA